MDKYQVEDLINNSYLSPFVANNHSEAAEVAASNLFYRSACDITYFEFLVMNLETKEEKRLEVQVETEPVFVSREVEFNTD